jgi:beta-glucosidase
LSPDANASHPGLSAYYNYLQGGRPVDAGRAFDNGTLVFGHQYVLDDVTPLYAFGSGLSYSNFTYDNLSLGSQNVSGDATVEVSVDVTNEGDVDGQEVVQIYFRDVVSSVVTPVKQLVGFAKVLIAAGETQTVHVNISVADMALWDEDEVWRVEPGEFTIWAGGASDNLPLNQTLYVV